MSDGRSDADGVGVTLERSPGWARLVLSGEIDLDSLPRVQGTVSDLAENLPAVVVIDLGKVTFMDSSGLGLLARLIRAARCTDARLTVTDPSPTIHRALSLCGLDRYLTMASPSGLQPQS